jgi:bifunctional non-homologous end joining protein LigD
VDFDLLHGEGKVGLGLQEVEVVGGVFWHGLAIEPVLVAQIKFTEWTSDGQLRQPVFLGLRSDKDPNEVVRE